MELVVANFKLPDVRLDRLRKLLLPQSRELVILSEI
jgi:hypothetical protein